MTRCIECPLIWARIAAIEAEDGTTTHRCPECGDVHLPPTEPETSQES